MALAKKKVSNENVKQGFSHEKQQDFLTQKERQKKQKESLKNINQRNLVVGLFKVIP